MINKTLEEIRKKLFKEFIDNKITFGEYEEKLEKHVNKHYIPRKQAEQEEAHGTEEGYCCACGYDIAGFEQEKMEAVKKYLVDVLSRFHKNSLEGKGFDFYFVLATDLDGLKTLQDKEQP